MKSFWQSYREDIVACCVILGTSFAIATFFGLSFQDKQQSCKFTPFVEEQVEVENHFN